MARKAKIFMAEEFAGILQENEDGKYTFKYEEHYLKRKNSQPISLTLPLREEGYNSSILFPFFDGLIPEGWLLTLTTKNWKLNPNDRMGLLLATCTDCIGAVQVFNYE